MINLVVSRLMLLWIVLFAVTAVLWPGPFLPLQPLAGYCIGFVLFLMGLTLDLKRLVFFFRNPAVPLIGICGKWIITFAISVALAGLFFPHHPQLAGGVILTGAVPSGTSASLFSLIGGGDVALSVTMSAADTFIGPAVTPVLARWGMGSVVTFAMGPFVWQMLKFVFIPLVTGNLLQVLSRRLSEGVRKATPVLSSVALYIVVLGVVSAAGPALLENRPVLLPLFIVAVLQVALPMIAGYVYARLWRLDEPACRSILFEVGIPNAALAAVLASTNIGPLAGLAAIVNLVCNMTLGAAAASILMLKPQKCITGAQ
jgi:BASS family bile acid:Na+ symporter